MILALFFHVQFPGEFGEHFLQVYVDLKRTFGSVFRERLRNSSVPWDPRQNSLLIFGLYVDVKIVRYRPDNLTSSQLLLESPGVVVSSAICRTITVYVPSVLTIISNPSNWLTIC